MIIASALLFTTISSNASTLASRAMASATGGIGSPRLLRALHAQAGVDIQHEFVEMRHGACAGPASAAWNRSIEHRLAGVRHRPTDGAPAGGSAGIGAEERGRTPPGLATGRSSACCRASSRAAAGLFGILASHPPRPARHSGPKRASSRRRLAHCSVECGDEMVFLDHGAAQERESTRSRAALPPRHRGVCR